MVWSYHGDALCHLRRYAEAIASYDRAIAINPYFADAWVLRGVAFANLGKHIEVCLFI